MLGGAILPQCYICNKTFKKITASHLKTHGISYDSYIKQYEPDKYYYKKSAELLEDLYISVRKAWLEQTNKDYVTKVKGKNRKWGLSSADIKAHTKGKRTIGVYFPKGKSNILALDLDIKDVFTLQEVYEVVNRFIPSKSILTSYSGNKGYHIDIFIEDMVEDKLLMSFYELIISETGLSKSKLELRGAGSQGYKLPLGIHQKTNNFCYVCDKHGRQLKDTEVLDKLESIERVSPEVLNHAIEVNDIVVLTAEQEKELRQIVESVKPLQIYKNPLDNLINTLETKGITEEGTRHNRAFVLGLAYRERGYCPKEIKQKLLEWHSNLDQELYNSTQGEIEKDCSYIANDVFKKDSQGNFKYKLPVLDIDREPIINREELLKILDITGHGRSTMPLRKLLFAMIQHSKMYADNQGVFYMTYEQMNEAMGTKNKREKLFRWIEMLAGLGQVEIVQRDTRKKGSKKHEPNKYKVINLNTGVNMLIEPKDKSFKICQKEKRCSSCLDRATCHLLEDKEIKELFSYRQAKKLSKTDKCPINSIAK